jgi:8-oxo-dGTP diphosphatase
MPENKQNQLKSNQIICTDKDGQEFWVSKKRLSFRPAVYGFLIEKGKLLLARQWDGYDFPGGAIEIGETIEEALVREFKEETGLKVKVGEIVLAHTSFFRLKFKKENVHSILLYYLCQRVGGKITTKYFADYEKEFMQEAEWVDLAQTKKLKFYNSADSLKIIQKALEKQKNI